LDNNKSYENISYILRYLLTFNITDPLSADSRGYSDYEQYFTGTNVAGQINYLERKPISGGKFIVQVSGVTKVDGVDYTLSVANGTITWTGYTPPASAENIYVVYTAVRQWIYDDHPNLDNNYWPRITVEQTEGIQVPPGMGIYNSYSTGIGDRITSTFVISIRNRKNSNYYTYSNLKLKNRDLVNAIAEGIMNYINSNKAPMPWRFNYWSVLSHSFDKSEEEYGIFKKDLVIECQYYHKSTVQ
jgi:hypothetical protein